MLSTRSQTASAAPRHAATREATTPTSRAARSRRRRAASPARRCPSATRPRRSLPATPGAQAILIESHNERWERTTMDCAAWREHRWKQIYACTLRARRGGVARRMSRALRAECWSVTGAHARARRLIDRSQVYTQGRAREHVRERKFVWSVCQEGHRSHESGQSDTVRLLTLDSRLWRVQ